MKRKLYCQFIEDELTVNIIDLIKNYYNPEKIFHFEILDSDTSILTFNSQINDKLTTLKLLLINRNFETNTLYTINGINILKEHEIPINWENYQNSFIFTRNKELVIQKLLLKHIYLNDSDF